ncbi:hypothetical protein SM124_14610 [Bacillus sp. 31A1R]|uniref:DUF4871 domain-containing protein n=1 Tax=Robertmurraya mangrovi TaxID=3098077 RepID=A0ABU5J0L7_9BACI|nr:hypothetical protein [Bacillus sp. 31A1R]MDZ5472947.1 hypothetical protein [Bacillus sp. 31A1R]
MEKELSHLRKAMNSSTHKGTRFTEIQKQKIRASLHQQEETVSRKPKISIYMVTTLAASLFVFLFYTTISPNLTSNGGGNQGTKATLEDSEWKVRYEYSKNGKVLFGVSPDPYLTAGKPFGYLFSFNEPFETYKGKNIEVFATHKETGERVNVIPKNKITEPSSGYSTLSRFTTRFTIPKSGLWKFEVFLNKEFYGDIVLSVGSGTILPVDIPKFVQKSDFEKVDWNRKAVYIDNNMLGNENKSGVIGADMPSININQKWMWHLWGIKNPERSVLTVVGFHKETGTVHQILTTGWSTHLGGENNGANAHIPSSVNISMAGEWAMLLYVDGKLFDVLVYNINS